MLTVNIPPFLNDIRMQVAKALTVHARAFTYGSSDEIRRIASQEFRRLSGELSAAITTHTDFEGSPDLAKAVTALTGFANQVLSNTDVDGHYYDRRCGEIEKYLNLAPSVPQPKELNVMTDAVIEHIESIEENKDNLRRLIEQLKANGKNLVPFIGAGLSRSYGYPLWSEFLLQQGDRARIRSVIEGRLSAGEFEDAAEEVKTARGSAAFDDAIEAAYGLHRIEGKTLTGIVTQVRKITLGPVITTNYDRVLEMGFDQGGTPFADKVWGARSGIATDALNKGERILLKLHGDYRDHTDRVLTKSDYEHAYGSAKGALIDFSKPLPHLLQQILIGRPLLFLGCSLSNDRTIGVLEHVAIDFGSTRHYAIVEHPESDDEFLRKSRFLADHNIRPIWYPTTRHELIEAILLYLLDKSNPT